MTPVFDGWGSSLDSSHDGKNSQRSCSKPHNFEGESHRGRLQCADSPLIGRMLRSLRFVKGANGASLRECWLFQRIRAHPGLMNHLESEFAKDPQGLQLGPDWLPWMLRLAALDVEIGCPGC